MPADGSARSRSTGGSAIVTGAPGCSAGSTAARWPSAGATRGGHRPRRRRLPTASRASSTPGADAHAGSAPTSPTPSRSSALRDAVLARSAIASTCWSTTPPSTTRSTTPRRRRELSRFENYPLEPAGSSRSTSTSPACSCAARSSAREMARRGRGSIINVASTYGMVAPDQRIYRRPDGTPGVLQVAPPTRPPRARCSRFTRFLATYWGRPGVRVQRALAGRRRRTGRTTYFVEQLRAADAARPHGAARRAARRGRLPGQRRVELHDRRQPGRRRRLDRMVTTDGCRDRAAAGARAARCAPRGSSSCSPTSTACSPTAASTTPSAARS